MGLKLLTAIVLVAATFVATPIRALAEPLEQVAEPMTLNDLTVSINYLKNKNFLQDWEWLIGKGKKPVLVTLAGDVFVQDKANNAVYFIDTIEGTATEVAINGDEFQQKLNDRNFVVKHFSVGLVAPLIKSGEKLKQGRVYELKKPPVLGGVYETSSLESTDLEVHFSILGQIWCQVSKLPNGAKIGKVEIK